MGGVARVKFSIYTTQPRACKMQEGPGHRDATLSPLHSQKNWDPVMARGLPRNSVPSSWLFVDPSLCRTSQEGGGGPLYRGKEWLITKAWGQGCQVEGPSPPLRPSHLAVQRTLWAPRIQPGQGTASGTSCREGNGRQGREGLSTCSCTQHPPARWPASSLGWTLPPPGLGLGCSVCWAILDPH